MQSFQCLHVGKAHRQVRGRIKHFFKKSVPVSSVLFTVATSCELWIVKLAHEEESVFTRFFFKQNLNKKSVGLLVGIINVIQNFVRVQFDNKNYLLSEKKLLLSGNIELNPGPAEIPNP